jgi:hypothetical protein
VHRICSDLLWFIDSRLEREGARSLLTRRVFPDLLAIAILEVAFGLPLTQKSIHCLLVSRPCLEPSLAMHHHHLATRRFGDWRACHHLSTLS